MRLPRRGTAPDEPVDSADPWRVPSAPAKTPRRSLADVADLVRQLSSPESGDEGEADSPMGRRARVRTIRQLSTSLVGSGRAAGSKAVLSGHWLSELVEQITPYVTVRDLATLQRTYGCDGDALAAAVIRSASHTTAAIGAAAGALAASEMVAPPTLLAAPVQLAAETLVIVSIELRLLGELHEVYGVPIPGTPAAKGTVLLTTWIHRRAFEPGAGLLFLGVAARRELRKRVLRRLGGSATALAPFLAGAFAGAELNRRETRRVGEMVANDLRAKAIRAFPADRLVDGDVRRFSSPG